jgi:hypothetical protein
MGPGDKPRDDTGGVACSSIELAWAERGRGRPLSAGRLFGARVRCITLALMHPTGAEQAVATPKLVYCPRRPLRLLQNWLFILSSCASFIWDFNERLPTDL